MEGSEQPLNYPVEVIYQGKGSSPYFFIIQPVPGDYEFHKDQEVHCINPKTDKLIRGTVTGDCWTFPWDEAPKGLIMREYGVTPQLVRTALILADPTFERAWARLIMIREK